MTTRPVAVSLADDIVVHEDVLKVEQRDGMLRIIGRDNELMAEYAPPPAGWRAWRWMPMGRGTVDLSKKPGQIQADLGSGYRPIPEHVPPGGNL